MWEVRDERFDYSYRKENRVFTEYSPRDFQRSRWLMYFHAGRYYEGARDRNARSAWALYLERENDGKRHIS